MRIVWLAMYGLVNATFRCCIRPSDLDFNTVILSSASSLSNGKEDSQYGDCLLIAWRHARARNFTVVTLSIPIVTSRGPFNFEFTYLLMWRPTLFWLQPSPNCYANLQLWDCRLLAFCLHLFNVKPSPSEPKCSNPVLSNCWIVSCLYGNLPQQHVFSRCDFWYIYISFFPNDCQALVAFLLSLSSMLFYTKKVTSRDYSFNTKVADIYIKTNQKLNWSTMISPLCWVRTNNQ